MKINCLHCGHKIDLGESYENYQGQIRCWVCGGKLEIETEEGSVKSAHLPDEDAQMK